MNNEKMQYLRIIGRLSTDNTLEIMTPYLTDRLRKSPQSKDGGISVKLFDKDEKMLLQYDLSTSSYCNLGAENTANNSLAIRGFIPFNPRTKIIRFYRDNTIILHEIVVSDDKPNVVLKWPQSSSSVKGKHTITWEGNHLRKQNIEYFLRYTNDDGKTWNRVSMRTYQDHYDIDFDTLPGGEKCKIAVVATDGVNTTVTESEPFVVNIKPCQSMIFQPKDDTEIHYNEPILFHGQGFYLEEGRPEKENLYWISSIDGNIGKGPIFKTNTLSVGSHKITLKSGKDGREGEATITIKVKGKESTKSIDSVGSSLFK